MPIFIIPTKITDSQTEIRLFGKVTIFWFQWRNFERNRIISSIVFARSKNYLNEIFNRLHSLNISTTNRLWFGCVFSFLFIVCAHTKWNSVDALSAAWFLIIINEYSISRHWHTIDAAVVVVSMVSSYAQILYRIYIYRPIGGSMEKRFFHNFFGSSNETYVWRLAGYRTYLIPYGREKYGRLLILFFAWMFQCLNEI